VGQAAVVARSLPHLAGQTQLVGYVSPRPRETVDLPALRSHLSSKLPEYSIPSLIVVLELLPLNVHGKVDRQALPEPARAELVEADRPHDALEAQLVQIWSSLLNTERIGVNDDFFELGGDSLSVLSMVLQVEQALGKVVPRSFLAEPTVRKLALSLQSDQQTPEPIDPTFRLQPRPPRAGAHRNPLARLNVRRRRVFRTLSRALDESSLMLWLLARSTRALTLAQAKSLVYRWADRRWLLNTVYARKQRLFRRYLASLGVSTPRFGELFRQNVIANLLFKLVEAGRPWRERDGSRLQRDRRRCIDESSIDELAQQFPVAGMEHLEAAYRLGRGVILLVFHGNADGKVSTRVLSRRLGGVPIQTVARMMAEKQSEFGARQLIPSGARDSIYAELAWHGQALLREGHVLRVPADNSGPGDWLLLDWTLGDRKYRIRPGFAELALNTGAAVIPLYARFLEDGRLSIHVQPPLQAGAGTRHEQVRALVTQYAAFVNDSVKAHPEMMLWKKMSHHLAAARVQVE
jgi:acyl carrier protein